MSNSITKSLVSTLIILLFYGNCSALEEGIVVSRTTKTEIDKSYGRLLIRKELINSLIGEWLDEPIMISKLPIGNWIANATIYPNLRIGFSRLQYGRREGLSIHLKGELLIRNGTIQKRKLKFRFSGRIGVFVSLDLAGKIGEQNLFRSCNVRLTPQWFAGGLRRDNALKITRLITGFVRKQESQLSEWFEGFANEEINKFFEQNEAWQFVDQLADFYIGLGHSDNVEFVMVPNGSEFVANDYESEKELINPDITIEINKRMVEKLICEVARAIDYDALRAKIDELKKREKGEMKFKRSEWNTVNLALLIALAEQLKFSVHFKREEVDDKKSLHSIELKGKVLEGSEPKIISTISFYDSELFLSVNPVFLSLVETKLLKLIKEKKLGSLLEKSEKDGKPIYELNFYLPEKTDDLLSEVRFKYEEALNRLKNTINLKKDKTPTIFEFSKLAKNLKFLGAEIFESQDILRISLQFDQANSTSKKSVETNRPD